jgi:hypothetical protein
VRSERVRSDFGYEPIVQGTQGDHALSCWCCCEAVVLAITGPLVPL